MALKMRGITLKGGEEALNTSESWSKNNLSTKGKYKNANKGKSQQETVQRS